MASTAVSLVDLPDEIISNILLYSLPEKSLPCSTVTADRNCIPSVLQVNRCLRSRALELYMQGHVVLNWWSIEDSMKSANHEGAIHLREFYEKASIHFTEIPYHWGRSSFYTPEAVHLDLSLSDENIGPLKKRERDFICTTHGLTFLLQLFHQPAYSRLSLTYKIDSTYTKDAQLFAKILGYFQLSSPQAIDSNNALLTSSTHTRQPNYNHQLGRPLHTHDIKIFIDTLIWLLRTMRTSIANNDIDSAISLTLHLGLPLLNSPPAELYRWDTFTNFLHLDLQQPDWSTNESLSDMFTATRLATHVSRCANLAYCISRNRYPGTLWARSHDLISTPAQSENIEVFGMTGPELESFAFAVVLQWANDSTSSSSLKSEDTADTNATRTATIQLEQLQEAYYAGTTRNPLHKRAYAKLATIMPAGLVESMLLDDRPPEPSIAYVDVDGEARVWDGGHDMWEAWQEPFADGWELPRARYLSRAQVLYHRGETFDDLDLVFLERFCDA